MPLKPRRDRRVGRCAPSWWQASSTSCARTADRCVHRLPHHLDASARHRYDFADPQWRELAYRTVLMEAGTVADLSAWLDRDVLIGLWPQLYLPTFVRAAWQRQHPELAWAGAGPTCLPSGDRPTERGSLDPFQQEVAQQLCAPSPATGSPWPAPARWLRTA